MSVDVSVAIATFLRSKIAAGMYTGASVVFGDFDRATIEVSAGTLDGRTDSATITPETQFDLQSLTKALITAPLSLKLEDAGLLRLSDPIDSYLPPDVPTELRGRGLTWRHLLTHAAGLSDLDYEYEFTDPAAAWDHIFRAPAHFTAGSGVEYGDVGYRILGRLLETVGGASLERLSRDLLFGPHLFPTLTYYPRDLGTVAATPDAHGACDDAQVRALGGVVGCDGVFGGARDVFTLLRALCLDEIIPNYLARSGEVVRSTTGPASSFTDALLFGPKALGWEVHSARTSYAGAFRTDTTLEKAGGAGTFAWIDPARRLICVYLTNHGRPKPFDGVGWNALVEGVAPHELSNVIDHARRFKS